ncbi:hypothetical protein, partial [Serratia fonticola]
KPHQPLPSVIQKAKHTITLTRRHDPQIDQKIIDEITPRYIHISSSWKNVLWPWGYAPEELSQEVKPEGIREPRAAIDNYQPNRPDTGWQRKIFNS